MAGHGGQEFQGGPDSCAPGRPPEGDAPHLYRQVQGGTKGPSTGQGHFPASSGLGNPAVEWKGHTTFAPQN